MPKEKFGPDYAFLSEDETLTIDEIIRVTASLAKLGVQKVRLTGGEPLLRKDLVDIVRQIADIDGIEDIALTTNGSLLTKKRAQSLVYAGLNRITISLDATKDAIFKAINDVSFPVHRVMHAVETAQAVGLNPVKINMVVRRGLNDSEILPMADLFRHSGAILRYIEYMDVGTTNGWKMEDVVSAKEILDMVSSEYPVEPIGKNQPGEVATRYRYLDGSGEIGLIHSVTNPFCGSCSRLRLTSEGDLFTCLFGAKGVPLREELRDGISDEDLLEKLTSIWTRRTDRYSELRTSEVSGEDNPRVEMSRIGG